jgi:hypothetical protein
MKPSLRIATATAVLALAAGSCGDASPEGVCWTTSTPEQLAERPSPLDSAVVTLGDADAKVCYGRPSARGRPVMGSLVRFDEVWRFGANEATTVRVPFPAVIGDVAVEPGAYSLYVVPGAESWTIVVNGMPERWGIPVDEAVTAEDLGSFQVPVEGLESPVETFTLSFGGAEALSAELLAEWELTRIRIPVRRATEG